MPGGAFYSGYVIRSGQMQKTIVVAISKLFRHPLVDRVYLRTGKVMVHDENMIGDVGDKVIIRKCRTYSKNKHFILDRIVEKDGAAAVLRQHPEYAKYLKRSDERKF